jgi:HK97 family phage portal protein
MLEQYTNTPQAIPKQNSPNSNVSNNITINLEEKASRVIKVDDIENEANRRPEAKLDYYGISDTINACVNYISETGALVKYKIGVLDSNGILVKYKDDKLNRLFTHAPNQFTTWQEFMEQSIQSYLLAGNTYMGFEKTKNYELWTLNPDNVKVVPHKTKFVEGYIYSDKVKYRANELVHVRRGSIQYRYYGTSAMLDVLGDLLTLEGYGLTDLQNFYKNGSIPSGLLKTEYPLNDKQVTDLKQQFKTAYGGKNRLSTIILPVGMDYKGIKISPKDSQLLESLDITEDRILKVFKLPAIVMGGLNKGTSYPYTISTIYRAVFNSAIMPITEKIRSSLELFFKEALKDDDIVIQADYSNIPYMGMITPEESEVAVKLFSSGLASANEMRAKLGFNTKKEDGFNAHFLPAYLLGSDVNTLENFDPDNPPSGSTSPSTPNGSLNPNGGDTGGIGSEGSGHAN